MITEKEIKTMRTWKGFMIYKIYENNRLVSYYAKKIGKGKTNNKIQKEVKS